MKVVAGWLLAIGLFLGFCVSVYYIRTDYNVDKKDSQIAELKYDKAVLSHAVILLEDSKNEVFLKAMTEKFPGIEEHKDIFNLIKLEKEKTIEEAEKERKAEESTEVVKSEDKEKRTIKSTFGDLLN